MGETNESSGNGMTGKVLQMDELVSYQRGAVVSRTLVDEDNGTVTLFAFDNNQGLSEHTAPYDALLFVLEGSAEVRLGEQNLILKKGGIVIMPAHKPHAVKAAEKFKMLLVMIKK